ncbi:MAG: hypothetical protein K2N11_02205 [Mucispirillum sp.]|nr:hypothetical protein [Mucispirillum sp.]
MRKLSIIFFGLLFFTNYAGAEEMKILAEIEIITGSEKAEGIVYDNNAGKSFLEILPITIKMSDYNNTEKIGKVGNKINVKGEPASFDPDKSDIAYYQPFGNLCFFYRDFGLSYGLYSIGKVTKGIEIFASKKNDFEITIKRK